jgi:methylenetetrahydrofolate reductase (NADPH)
VALLPESFSIDIPLELTQEIAKAGDDRKAIYNIGAEWCAMQCKELISHGVPAVHFYTMGKSGNIVKILRECF